MPYQWFSSNVIQANILVIFLQSPALWNHQGKRKETYSDARDLSDIKQITYLCLVYFHLNGWSFEKEHTVHFKYYHYLALNLPPSYHLDGGRSWKMASTHHQFSTPSPRQKKKNMKIDRQLGLRKVNLENSTKGGNVLEEFPYLYTLSVFT